jgi:hypothetical protein
MNGPPSQAPVRIRLLTLIDPDRPGGEIWRRPGDAFGGTFELVGLDAADPAGPAAPAPGRAPCAVLITGDRTAAGLRVAASDPAVSRLILLDPPPPVPPPAGHPPTEMGFGVTVIRSGIADPCDLTEAAGWAAWSTGRFELRMTVAPAAVPEGFAAVRRHILDSLQVWWLDAVVPSGSGAGP